MPSTHTARKARGLRMALDAWHATVARYLGLLLLLYSVLVDHFHNPALLPAATGLIFYKTVTLSIKEKPGLSNEEE